MCLAVPGQILTIAPASDPSERQNGPGLCMGTVRFGGIVKEICLSFVPEAKPGDYVIVHAGFAIRCIDEAEAQAALAALDALGASPDPAAAMAAANHAFPR